MAKRDIVDFGVHKHVPSYLFWLILLCLALFAVGCSEGEAERPKKNNIIQRGDHVHFRLGGATVGTDFKIPKAYFKGGSEGQWGILQSVELWALLPDFEAYNRSKNHFEFVEELGWGRKLFISLRSRSVGAAPIPQIIKLKAEGKYRPISGRLGQYDELLYGLEVYRSGTYGDDDYLFRPNGETQVYIHCSSKRQNVPSPSCMMLWDFSDGVAADATFSMRFLPQWKTILDRANSLIGD